MKKVFMSFAVIAMMVAISACGNKSAKAETETEVAVEATEVECEADTTACADSTVVEAATEAVAE